MEHITRQRRRRRAWNHMHMHAWRARKPERMALWKYESVGLWKAGVEARSGEPCGEPARGARPGSTNTNKRSTYTNFTGSQSTENRTASLPFSRSIVTIHDRRLRSAHQDTSRYERDYDASKFTHIPTTTAPNLFYWRPARLLNTCHRFRVGCREYKLTKHVLPPWCTACSSF